MDSANIDEELMAVYFITLLLKMFEKQKDAMKALKEYQTKKKISVLGLANLQKLKAVMIMSAY